MAASVRVEAPAKLNLHLRVRSRRPDGYHGILSLFQAVSLTDSLVVRSLKEPDAVVIDGDFDCPPERTTIHKAVVAFREATGLRGGVRVSVDKRIPAGAGLGGGSSDAASTLVALDALFRAGLGRGEMASLCASIGSDVPFFLDGGAAMVSGRGERVEPVEPRVDWHAVVVFPGFPMGTARAYYLLDDARPDDSREPDPTPAAIEAGYRGEIGAWPFANSFEPIVGAAHPAILRVRDRLRELASSFAAMSGSGSAVFGAFEDPDRAQAARQALEADGLQAHAVLPLARPPALG